MAIRRTAALSRTFPPSSLAGLASLQLSSPGITKSTILPTSRSHFPLSENSTSLVDSTAASDIASVSTTLSAFSSKARTPNSTDVNSTFSAYAIYAMLRQKSPFDPDLFTRESTLRSLSFTYADSFPSDKGATADQGSRTYGAKYLIHAGRDLASPINDDKRKSILNALENQLGPASEASKQVEDFLFQRLGPTPKTPAARAEYLSTLGNEAGFHAAVAALNEEDFRRIDSILQNAALAQLRVTNASTDAAREIVHASQFSAGFSTKISKGNDKNTYRSEFIHDKQFTDWLKETVNVGWDFQNAQKVTAKNRQIGRVALQGETRLNGYGRKTASYPSVSDLRRRRKLGNQRHAHLQGAA